MKMIKNNLPDNCNIVVGSNIRDWKVILTGIKGSICEGETFEMRMQFPNSYPAKPPSVYFVKPNHQVYILLNQTFQDTSMSIVMVIYA